MAKFSSSAIIGKPARWAYVEIGGERIGAAGETMKDPEKEVKDKLAELETALQEESQQQILATDKTSSLSSLQSDRSENSKESINADMQLLGGFTLIGASLLMILNHAKISTGLFTMFGLGTSGAGFLFLPLLIGVGLLFYDYKNKLGWLMTGGGLAAVIFVLLSQLVIYFPQESILGFILMFLPLAIGGALIAKGSGARRQVENKGQ